MCLAHDLVYRLNEFLCYDSYTAVIPNLFINAEPYNIFIYPAVSPPPHTH